MERPGPAPAGPARRDARKRGRLREAMLCLVVAGLSFVAWPLAEAAVSASMLARQAAWLSGSVAFGLWRALVAAVDGLVGAFAAPRAASRALATRRAR